MIDAHHGWNVSYKPQVIGFILSIILTLAAYRIVAHYHLSNWILAVTVVGLGSAQALIQLIFFLHLGLETKPRWNVMMFLFLVLVSFILVGGSIWIMYNLNYNVMPMGER
ncbi:MAG: Cytochrome bo(3) ubiquinol oxidase subunit 4 [Chlamydiae bacterium]|nr:Cytochrome bo(3) ubiquinol oxidase subunit 4 [Chlamydiota bacterium]